MRPGAPAENGVAPGSIVSIFGASFAPETAAGPENPLAQAIGCVTVRSGGRLLPLFFVSPSQINLQLPDDTPLGEQRVVVSCQGLPDVEATVHGGAEFAGSVPRRGGARRRVAGDGGCSGETRGAADAFTARASVRRPLPRPFGFAPVRMPRRCSTPGDGAGGRRAIAAERPWRPPGRVGRGRGPVPAAGDGRQGRCRCG